MDQFGTAVFDRIVFVIVILDRLVATSASLFFVGFEGVEFFRAILFGFDDGPKDGKQEDGAAKIEGVFYGIGDHSFGRRVGDIKPVGHDVGKEGSNEGGDSDEEGLHSKASGTLFGGEHIAYECAEGFHGDVDGSVHDPKHAGCHP